MKSRLKYWIVIIFIGLVIISSLYFADSSFLFESESENKNDQIGLKVGNIAPNFSLEDLDGEKFELSDYQDQFVILDFMATWCTPCKIEMDHLRTIYENYSQEKIAIISIDVDPTEKKGTIREFKEEFGSNWTFASGPQVGARYKVSGIPTLYVLSPNQEIIFKNSGVVSASTISKKIDGY